MEVSKTTRDILISALNTLKTANIPFLVGGSFALLSYTGYLRTSDDLELFLYKRNVDKAMSSLCKAGFETKMESDHWLAKASMNDTVVNLIFGASNWVFQVDKSFFDRAVPGEVLDVPVQLLAPEEFIWTESYAQSRERFDGSGITHLISASKGKLDWKHLLDRFGGHWQLLLSDVLLYGFVYPGERDNVPAWLMTDLAGKMHQVVKEPPAKDKVCQGILLDRFSFVYDIERAGYRDQREDFAKKHGYSAKQVAEDRKQADAILKAALIQPNHVS